MRKLLLIAILMAAAISAHAAEPTDDFVVYMKSVLNPLDFGVREKRYYPYLTPFGRRIGYGHTVDDLALYTKGWSREEADRQLRAQIAASLQELRAFLAKNQPAHPFDQLDPKSQEILLDFTVTEGAANLSPEFYRAVLAQDWNKLIHGYLYLRYDPGRPNQIENHAFAQRWIYGRDPLIIAH